MHYAPNAPELPDHPSAYTTPDQCLFLAIHQGDVARARQALDDGADPNGADTLYYMHVDDDDQRYAESQSVGSLVHVWLPTVVRETTTRLALTHLLLTRGASPDVRDPHGLLLAELAVRRQQPDLLEVLADHGASIDASALLHALDGMADPECSADINYEPNMDAAILPALHRLVQFLVAKGGDLQDRTREGAAPWEAALSFPAPLQLEALWAAAPLTFEDRHRARFALAAMLVGDFGEGHHYRLIELAPLAAQTIARVLPLLEAYAERDDAFANHLVRTTEAMHRSVQEYLAPQGAWTALYEDLGKDIEALREAWAPALTLLHTFTWKALPPAPAPSVESPRRPRM